MEDDMKGIGIGVENEHGRETGTETDLDSKQKRTVKGTGDRKLLPPAGGENHYKRLMDNYPCVTRAFLRLQERVSRPTKLLPCTAGKTDKSGCALLHESLACAYGHRVAADLDPFSRSSCALSIIGFLAISPFRQRLRYPLTAPLVGSLHLHLIGIVLKHLVVYTNPESAKQKLSDHQSALAGDLCS